MDSSVLIIDDNPLDLKVFEAAFNNQGVETVTLQDPTKALEYTLKYKPSFVILDLYMPQADGFEVCAVLKTHPMTRDIPVIFVTGSDSLEDATRSLHMGVIDYFHKPVSVDHLVTQVMKHEVISKLSDIFKPVRNEMAAFCEKYKDGI